MATITSAIFNSLSADLSIFEAGQLADLPAVVLLPGLTCSAYRFLESLLPLAQKTKLIAVELPGHGKSVSKKGVIPLKSLASDVTHLLRARLPGARICCVAHSMGAKILWALLDHFDEELDFHVVSVALIDGTAPAAATGKFRAGPRDVRHDSLRENFTHIAQGKEQMLAMFARMFRTGFVHSDQEFAEWQKFLADCDPTTIANLYWEHVTTDFTHVVSSMSSQKVLVVGGDRTFSPCTLKPRLLTGVPQHGAHMAILPGGTHCLFYQAALAERLVKLILQLLSGSLEPNTHRTPTPLSRRYNSLKTPRGYLWLEPKMSPRASSCQQDQLSKTMPSSCLSYEGRSRSYEPRNPRLARSRSPADTKPDSLLLSSRECHSQMTELVYRRCSAPIIGGSLKSSLGQSHSEGQGKLFPPANRHQVERSKSQVHERSQSQLNERAFTSFSYVAEPRTSTPTTPATPGVSAGSLRLGSFVRSLPESPVHRLTSVTTGSLRAGQVGSSASFEEGRLQSSKPSKESALEEGIPEEGVLGAGKKLGLPEGVVLEAGHKVGASKEDKPHPTGSWSPACLQLPAPIRPAPSARWAPECVQPHSSPKAASEDASPKASLRGCKVKCSPREESRPQKSPRSLSRDKPIFIPMTDVRAAMPGANTPSGSMPVQESQQQKSESALQANKRTRSASPHCAQSPPLVNAVLQSRNAVLDNQSRSSGAIRSCLHQSRGELLKSSPASSPIKPGMSRSTMPNESQPKVGAPIASQRPSSFPPVKASLLQVNASVSSSSPKESERQIEAQNAPDCLQLSSRMVPILRQASTTQGTTSGQRTSSPINTGMSMPAVPEKATDSDVSTSGSSTPYKQSQSLSSVSTTPSLARSRSPIKAPLPSEVRPGTPTKVSTGVAASPPSPMLANQRKVVMQDRLNRPGQLSPSRPPQALVPELYQLHGQKALPGCPGLPPGPTNASQPQLNNRGSKQLIQRLNISLAQLRGEPHAPTQTQVHAHGYPGGSCSMKNFSTPSGILSPGLPSPRGRRPQPPAPHQVAPCTPVSRPDTSRICSNVSTAPVAIKRVTCSV